MKVIIRITWVQPKQKKIVSENYRQSPCRTTWASEANTHLRFWGFGSEKGTIISISLFSMEKKD